MGLSMNKEQYGRYLRSPYWRAVRIKVLQKKGAYCSVCGKVNNLQVHHTNYDNLGSDMQHLDALEILCVNCHKREHKLLWWQKLATFIGL